MKVYNTNTCRETFPVGGGGREGGREREREPIEVANWYERDGRREYRRCQRGGIAWTPPPPKESAVASQVLKTER